MANATQSSKNTNGNATPPVTQSQVIPTNGTAKTPKPKLSVKEELARLDAEKKALREQQAKAKEDEKRLKEEAKAAKEAAAKEQTELSQQAEDARQEAISVLSTALTDAVASLSPMSICTFVPPAALSASLLASDDDNAKALGQAIVDAVTALEAAGGLRGKKARAASTVDGAPKRPKEYDLTRLNAQHVRMLSHLRDCTEPVTGKSVACATESKESVRKQVVWWLGAPHAATMASRGFVRVTEVDVDGKKERMFSITQAGKKALAAAEKAAQAS